MIKSSPISRGIKGFRPLDSSSLFLRLVRCTSLATPNRLTVSHVGGAVQHLIQPFLKKCRIDQGAIGTRSLEKNRGNVRAKSSLSAASLSGRNSTPVVNSEPFLGEGHGVRTQIHRKFVQPAFYHFSGRLATVFDAFSQPPGVVPRYDAPCRHGGGVSGWELYRGVLP